jgi:hypothetical protein
MRTGTRARLLPLAMALALVALAGCGSDEPSSSSGGASQGFTPPEVPMLQSLGEGEGKVNLVAWAGYVEDGSTDKSVDWVTPFEKETGCQVNVKVAATSDEMVQLMKSGQYDAVSASGDASLRLVAAGDAAPVNTDLVPNYKDVFEALKMQPWNSVNGKAYGIPHGRGANLLMWRTDVVKTEPDSWGVVFDANSPYKGKVTAYDSPIYIADAALYLKATKRHDLADHRQPGRGRQGPGQGDPAQGGQHRLVRHLDGLLQGGQPQLCLHVDKPRDLAQGQRPDRRVVRRGPGQQAVVPGDGGQEPLRHLPCRRRGLLRPGRLLDHPDQGVRRRPRRGLQGLLGLDDRLDRDQGLGRR